MKIKLAVILVTMILCMSNIAFAATGSSSVPVIQITDTSTVPSTVYPGTVGYAKLTLTNTGTDAATAVTVYYTYSQTGASSSTVIGDISASSTAQVSIPFKAPEQASGLFAINVDVYYNGLSTQVSKRTSISIPITVSQYAALEVTTDRNNNMLVTPGEILNLRFEVKNTGGTVNNLIITTPDNSSFSLEGSSQKSLGNIASNLSINVTLDLVASSAATVGQYTIPLTFTYQDALGTTVAQILYLGPVSILESSSQFRISMVPQSPAEIGLETVFNLTIENTGTTPITAVVDLNATTAFTPIGVSRVYFEPIAPGKTVSKNVSIGISSAVSSGYYILPIGITLGTGKTTTQSVGIAVVATPSVTISSTGTESLTPGSEGKVTLQISNTGNAAIRSVYSIVDSGNITIIGTADKFIGTLNVDDFATLTVSVSIPTKLNSGLYPLPVTISFKDSNNELHILKKNVTIDVSGRGSATLTNTTTRKTTNGVLFGLSWLQLGLIVIILIGAFFGYKRFEKREKREVQRHEK